MMTEEINPAREPNNGAVNSHAFESSSEDLLRRKLKYFFMNPYEKWQAKRRFPWKLVFQLIKIVFVTVQLAVFGVSRASHVEFIEKSIISFKHLYVKDWSSSLETLPYPPTNGAFAIYTHDGLYDAINYAMEQYNLTEDIAVGTYQFTRPNASSHIPPITLCKSHYKLGKNWSRNQSYAFDANLRKTCLPIKHITVTNTTTGKNDTVFDIKTYLRQHNQSINFDGLNAIELQFNLTAIHLKYLSRRNTPDCYEFYIRIIFDNSAHSGQMLIKLESDKTLMPCFGEITYPKMSGANLTGVISMTIFDTCVLLVSLFSGALCARSLVRGHKLKLKTSRFFRSHYGKELTFHDRMEFLNLWYLLIIINDILTILGSGFKIGIENKISYNYEACGIMLGTGSLLVWFGVLRYLGLFHKYNILIITMKKSAPNVLRFLVCASFFYLGFAVCGWVVLGPYHIKFKTISGSSEALYALVNGDEQYMTFASVNYGKQIHIWFFSRLYLYSFMSLFTYMVLNLFMAVIMDAYKTIKNYNKYGFPKSTIEEFMEQCTDDAPALFRSYSTSKQRRMAIELDHNCPLCICGCLPFSCCHRNEDSGSMEGEQQPLLS